MNNTIEVLRCIRQIYAEKDNSQGMWSVTLETLDKAIATLKAVEEIKIYLDETIDKSDKPLLERVHDLVVQIDTLKAKIKEIENG